MTLPKWPAMVVSGKRVTEDQAAEILIKTSRLPDYVTTNNRLFEQQLLELFKIPTEWDRKDHVAISELARRMGILDLEYLVNDRIASSFIGGPHGWCNWNGDIFSNNYNIGKYPSEQTVMAEWELIAKTFPYLDLQCWLMGGETCEPGKPLVWYGVSHGAVAMVTGSGDGVDIPECHIPVCQSDLFGSIMGLVSGFHDCEIGITIQMLKEQLLKVYGEIPTL